MIEEIGSGMFSTVYKAERNNTDHAIKVIKKKEINMQLYQETSILKLLHHPNIVELHEVINDEASPNLCIVMQYLEGPSLDMLHEPPSAQDVWKWSRQLISALYMCHVQENVIHRDIKPENMKLHGAEQELVMLDFGAGNCFKGTSDRVYDTVGTKIYYAPEILARSKDGVKFMYGKRCDIWAAGVTLFEIAAQRNPFHTTEGLM